MRVMTNDDADGEWRMTDDGIKVPFLPGPGRESGQQGAGRSQP